MAINFPNSPSIGDVFTDTTSGFSYEWTGAVWKSFSSSTASNIQILDDISSSFNNSLTTFNLTVGSSAVTPATAQQIEVVLGGIQQAPGVDYTISASTVVFTTAPTNGLTFSGKLLGTALSLNTIPADTDGSGLVSLNASELDSGTVPDARFPATLPAASGANLTSLPAANLSGTAAAINGSSITDLNGSNIASGTVAAARVATLNQNTTGTAGGLTGTPDITVNNITGAAVTFSGDLTINGTLTYEDVTNVDAVGIVTARTGIKVLAGGINVVSGVSTFKGANFNGGLLLREKINIVADKLSVVPNINLDNGMVHHFTTQETATAIPNIMSTVGINTQMSTGDAVAVTIITTAAAAGYSTCITIDNAYNDVKWSGGADPSTGGSSGNDVYALQIIKTGSAAYTVLGALNNFA